MSVVAHLPHRTLSLADEEASSPPAMELTGRRRMSAAERSAIDTVEAGREDVIVAGAVIVSRLMRFLGIEELTVSEKDILNGAARWLASGDPDPR